MINEKYFDIKTQRNVLDAILASSKKRFPEKADAFNRENYFITVSNGKLSDFNGKYYHKEDWIGIDKMFIYDMLCSYGIAEIRNTVVHEEAHRQVILNGKEDAFADHWENWLKEYLSMGGKPPEAYFKIKSCEVSMEYSEIKQEDIKNLIIITDDGKDLSKKLIAKRSAIYSPFLVVEKDGQIKRNNFKY